MTESTEKKTVAPRTDLADEVRESAKAGQHAASEALREFYRTVDEAIPESVQPLRKRIVDAAIELADRARHRAVRVPPQYCAERGSGTEQVR